MAYQGAYGNTAVPQQTGGGNWYDILTKLLSGLKGAGQGIGQGAGAVGQGAAGALSSIGPQLPEILKILGSIGKGVGQTATMVGRQLPYAGPLVQAGEYGILNAVGKEDSPWAQGNAFIQRDKANKEQELMAELMRTGKGLANTQTEQVNEQNKWELSQNPLKERDNLLGIQNKEQGLRIGNLQLEALEQKKTELMERLKVMPYDMQAKNELEDIDLKLEGRRQENLLTGAQRETQGALKGMYTQRGTKDANWEPPAKTLPSYINDDAWNMAVSTTPGVMPFQVKDQGITRLPAETQKALMDNYHKFFGEMVEKYYQGAGGSTTMQDREKVPAGGTANVPPDSTANIPPPAGSAGCG